MAEAAEEKTEAYSGEDMMYAGADPIVENEDLGNYDVDDEEVRPTDEDTDEAVVTEDETKTEETTAEEETETEETEAEAETTEEETETVEETEGEAEAEAEAEAETTEEEAEPDVKQHQIPKWRLDQEIAKRRRLEEQLKQTAPKDEIIQNAPKELQLDVQEQEKEYADMLLDGKVERAAQIRADINQKIMQETYRQARADIETTIDERVTQKSNQTALDTVIGELEQNFEVLRPGTENFDEALINEIGAVYNGYVGNGYEPAEAMRTAADMVLKSRVPELFAPEPALEEEQGLRAVDNKATPTRKQKDVQRNVDAAQSQPPTLPKSNTESDPEIKVDSLSDEEFDALPEATKRRLRGDFG